MSIKYILFLPLLLVMTSCNFSLDAPPPRTAIYLAEISISGEDLGKVYANEGAVKQLTIENTGSVDVKDMKFTDTSLFASKFEYDGKKFPGTTGDCSSTLRVGQSCTVAIASKPSRSIGPMSEHWELTYTDADGKQKNKDVKLKILVEDQAKLLVKNLDFATVQVGDKQRKKFILENLSVVEDVSISIDIPAGVFTQVGTSMCNTVSAGSNCETEIEMKPLAAGNYVTTVNINYWYPTGDVMQEQIYVTGQGVDDGPLTAAVTSPTTARVLKNGRFTIEVEFTHNRQGIMTPATNFDLDYNLPDGFRKTTASTCTSATSLNPMTSCKLVLESKKQIFSRYHQAHQGIIKYTSNGNNKFAVYSVVQDVHVVNNEPEISGSNLGHQQLSTGQRLELRLKVTNYSPNAISQLKITGLPAVSATDPFSVDKLSSNCRKATINANGSCDFVLEANPTADIPSYNKRVALSYVEAGVAKTKNIVLTGSIKMHDWEDIGSGFMVLGNHFGHRIVEQGDAFEVKLQIENRTGTQITVRDTRRHPKFFHIATKSTCGAALVMGGKCDLVLSYLPETSDKPFTNTSVGIIYLDAANNPKVINVKLQGDWDILAKGPQVGQPGSPPLRITSRSTVADRWFNYIKRPMRDDVINRGYAQWVYDTIIAGNIVGGYGLLSYLPWTFGPAVSAGTARPLITLKDVVPDRIVDASDNNKVYIKMYHGTTKAALASFIQGANRIDPLKTVSKALGGGFYLSASPNESKGYACNASSATNPPILLVVGVEERAEIVGKYVNNLINDELSDYITGKPKDPSIYFGRNGQGMHNQFVFFTNALQYMKIFEIIDLANGYLDVGIHDNNGWPESNRQLPINRSCRW